MPSFSRTAVDDDITHYTLGNAAGMRVVVSDLGARPIAWWAPDRYGHFADVLRGTDEGTTAGPICYAPRSGAGRHAGSGTERDGRPRLRWLARCEGDGLRLAAANDDSGSFVLYRLDDAGCLSIDYCAAGYGAARAPAPRRGFNLNGDDGDVGDHILSIDAECYLRRRTDGGTPDIVPVAGSPFDFRHPAPIGPRLAWPDLQLALSGGFDHCFLLPAAGTTAPRAVASIYHPGSGRRLTVATSDGGLRFCGGGQRHDGLRLEPACLPGSAAAGEGVQLRRTRLTLDTLV
jgi:aldose 1-epimerase